MNMLIKAINYLLVGQYYAALKYKFKEKPELKNQEFDKTSTISVSFDAPAYTLVFPFFFLLWFILYLIFPKFIVPYPKVFALFLAIIMVALFEFIFKRFYFKNQLYIPVLKEYERLNEREKKNRRLIQISALFFSVFGSLFLMVVIGVYAKSHF
jgi:hypothetical protein